MDRANLANMAKRQNLPPEVPSIGHISKLHLYIEERQDAAGLSDVEFAKACGVVRETIWKWKRRPRSLDSNQLARVASALKCGVLDLYQPPGFVSIDAKLADATASERESIAGIVENALKMRRSS